MREIQVKIKVPEWVYRLGVKVVLVYRRVRYGCAFRRIALTQGKYTIVDAEDYERLSKYNWFAARSESGYYAVRAGRAGGRHTNVKMHREIVKGPSWLVIDHKNHNGLDNRRSNMRTATSQQNVWNKRKQRGKYSSIYKGVSWLKSEGRWQARIMKDKRRIFIGYFDDEEAAARAYDARARELFGEYAAPNFPSAEAKNTARWSFRICGCRAPEHKKGQRFIIANNR